MRAILISDISEIYGITQLASSICCMLNLGDNGTSMWQWDYHTNMLPLTFHFLDMWTNFCIAVYDSMIFTKQSIFPSIASPKEMAEGLDFPQFSLK